MPDTAANRSDRHEADLAGPTAQPYVRGKAGVLPRQDIHALVARRVLRAPAAFEPSQFQPASLDLRLGARAYRVRASFLPGAGKTVKEKLDELGNTPIELEDGAIFEQGRVYVVELEEQIQGLPDSLSAVANPKSSTGRLDVFTRLITDKSETFDTVASGYTGHLYAEISPSSFSIRVKRGSRLNQIRFRSRNSQHLEHEEFKVPDKALEKIHGQTPLTDGEAKIRKGLVLHIDLNASGPDPTIGFRAKRHTDIIDVDQVGAYRPSDYWEPIHAQADRRLILDPDEFYILVSKERLHIPPMLAAEMVPIDPTMGEFRVHYAGFFDPGFGWSSHGHPGSRAVLEVRSREVPFILEHGQVIGRLAYERMLNEPDMLYGQGGTANYQGQALKLSKHFWMGA